MAGTLPMKLPTHVIYASVNVAPSHPRMRLAPHPGGPKLRAPGSEYPKTGFRGAMGTIVTSDSVLPLRVLRSAAKMPDNFCWQPGDLTSTLDQGKCGSCWAHAIATVLGDRVAVATNGAVRTAISVQQVMECSKYMSGLETKGCSGNEVYIAAKSLSDNKTRLNAYTQYTRKYTESDVASGDVCAQAPEDGFYVVPESAWAVTEPIKSIGDAAHLRNMENMKQHIYNEGPIVGIFNVYSDFHDYDGTSIYEPSASATLLGGHAVEIVGWGKDPSSGASYWILRNSWGLAWPARHKKCAGSGVFYMRMGKNTCQLEAYAVGLNPKHFNGDKAPKDKGGHYPGEICVDALQNKIFQMTRTAKGAIAAAVCVAVVAGAAYYAYRQKISSTRTK